MNWHSTALAISEAKKFVEKAEAALNDMGKDVHFCFGTPRTAAARRASMDLTRALAKMRKSS